MNITTHTVIQYTHKIELDADNVRALYSMLMNSSFKDHELSKSTLKLRDAIGELVVLEGIAQREVKNEL